MPCQGTAVPAGFPQCSGHANCVGRDSRFGEEGNLGGHQEIARRLFALLVPKLPLGNAASRSSASRAISCIEAELPERAVPSGAWDRVRGAWDRVRNSARSRSRLRQIRISVDSARRSLYATPMVNQVTV